MAGASHCALLLPLQSLGHTESTQGLREHVSYVIEKQNLAGSSTC